MNDIENVLNNLTGEQIIEIFHNVFGYKIL